MVKFCGSATSIFVFGYLGTFIGWWGLAIIATIVGFVFQMNGFKSFLSGFIGGGLFFGTYAFVLDAANESRLSSMMTELLQFDPFWATVLIGAFLGGLGMLCGKYLRDVISGEQKNVRYRGKYI
ncbi:MAG: hypothetical protein MK207_11770 [Saprospiraceae bacterium]|nr:hypothetical protein [Saprospiraceae bacterium]